MLNENKLRCEGFCKAIEIFGLECYVSGKMYHSTTNIRDDFTSCKVSRHTLELP